MNQESATGCLLVVLIALGFVAPPVWILAGLMMIALMFNK